MAKRKSAQRCRHRDSWGLNYVEAKVWPLPEWCPDCGALRWVLPGNLDKPRKLVWYYPGPRKGGRFDIDHGKPMRSWYAQQDPRRNRPL